MMTKESYTQTVNCMTLMEGVVVIGCGHIGDIVKMLNFIKIFYSTPGHRAD